MIKLQIQLFAEPEATGIEKNYLEEIQALKTKMESMVPGEDYNRVLDEHKRLTNEYINKRQPEVKTQTDVDPAKIAAEFKKLDSTNQITNLEYIEKALLYRDTLLEKTGFDVFANKDQNRDDLLDAGETAEAFRTLITQSEGKDTKFKLLMNEALSDDTSVLQKLRRK